MTGVVGRPAREIAERVRNRDISAVEVAQHLDHIVEVDPGLNALPVVLADEALTAAAEVDRRIAAGEPAGPLAGVPVSVKINIDVAGSAMSSGVAALAGQVPRRDAPVVERLRAAGAVVVARSNMPDFGMRWHSDSGTHGATVNPWDAALSPGGSSGGEAAALATGMSALGLGNDYGGSLRLPSLAAGTFALKPTTDRDGYVGALVERHALTRAWAELTGTCPLVLGPVASDGTSAVGRDLSGPEAVRDMWTSHRFPVAANLLGVPAPALPTGLDSRGLPTGVQLVGAAHGELDLLAAARTVERAHPHVPVPPPR